MIDKLIAFALGVVVFFGNGTITEAIGLLIMALVVLSLNKD